MANLSTNQAATTLDLGGDLTVRRLGFGAMRITGEGIWGEPADHDEAIATLRRALELGVNFVDTADSYGPFVSERLIAEALYPYPDELVIATKGGMTRSGPGQWGLDGRPQHLRAACDESLQRLHLEQIPLYQFHRPDPNVPFDDSVGMLAELKDEGKVRHIGLSNVTEDQLDQALRLTPIVSVQNRYSPADRSSEAMVDRCESESLAFQPWGPVEQGAIARDAAVERVAKEHEATAHQVALAWLLARSPVMLPIPGTASVAHVEENMQATSLRLSPEEVAELNTHAVA
jgi:aryl-alcohol dehydrogenase-like predicted oxidoreductase